MVDKLAKEKLSEQKNLLKYFNFTVTPTTTVTVVIVYLNIIFSYPCKFVEQKC